jgi:hypothetical protein
MKLPSLQKLRKATVQAIFRFPLEIFCAIVGTGLLLWVVEHEGIDTEEHLLRLVLCCVLGLVVFLSITVFSESRALSKMTRSLLQVGGVFLLVACWFAIAPEEKQAGITRYMFLVVAFHLLVSCAPKTSIAGFWEYNKQLFIRILTAQLYSWVLFGGLCVAVASSNFLFNLDIDEKIYAHLYILIVGLFNTIFFLAGVPDTTVLAEQHYPKGLKVFTQYVLIPLATIYLIIILAYEGKVIVEWSLPKGIISWLILGYAVYGMLSILLVYPVRLLQENNWIKTYSRLFYFLIIPLLPLLGLAIGMRVLDYGITEARYTVLVLSFWLTGITVYFLISRTQNIKLIPLTLALLAILSTWGPQSASSVSERSQVNRLIELFQSQNSFEAGKLKPMPATISDSIGNEAVGQLRFLIDRYDVSSIHHLLPAAIQDSLVKTDTIKVSYSQENAVQEMVRKGFGLQTYYANNVRNHTEYYQVATAFDSVAIDGYAYMKNLEHHDYDLIKSVVLQGDSLVFQGGFVPIYFNVSKVFTAIEQQQASEGTKYPNRLASEKMTAEPFAKEGKPVKLLIKKLYYNKDSATRTLQEMEGLILYGQ